ncbi:MAG: hypothetical protein K9N23_20525 [Akkermansiaceae bacterium]|nr:hypothetical protein [Akkermansiaceae bacterium]
MIEKLHRYRTLLVLGLVLVAAALVIGMGSGGQRSAGGARAVLGVAGKTYDSRDYQKLAVAPVQLSQMMLRMGDFAMYQFVFELAKGATSQDDMAEKFFVGRVILRNARDEYGIHPGAPEVSDFIREMRAFADTPAREPGVPPAAGAFDEKKYREFIDRTIGRLGLTENDFLDLAADMLALSKLKSVLGSGVVADRDSVATENLLKRQTITADIARFDLTPFEEKIQPSEQEIKDYWGPIKDEFKTEARRKFSYVLVTPVFPVEPAAEDEPKETLAEAAATPEAREAARKKREEEKTLKAAAAADKRREIQMDVDVKVDEFTTTLEDNVTKPGGKTFEEMCQENGWVVKTTDLFTLKDVPAELDLTIRASSQGGKAIDGLFKIHPNGEDEISKYSQPIPVGDGQWLIARLDGEEKVREMTYSEARADARAKLIEIKSTADMKAAAEEAIKQVKEALAAGKSFADAAKEAGTVESKSITDLTSARPADSATEPSNLFQAVSTVDPGTFGDVIMELDRAFIAYVVKREVVKDPNSTTTVDSAVSMANNTQGTLIFDSWLAARVEDAKVDQIYKHQ